MKQYDKEKPLISIHIPKCAGRSLEAILKDWFKDNFRVHYYDEKNNKMPLRYELRPGLCIHGHFNRIRKTGALDYYPKVDQFITILRDPFEVAVSHYFYLKRWGENWFREGKKFVLKDHFRSIRDYLTVSRSYLLRYMPCEITIDNYQEIFEKYFVYVGIAEDMQTSINMLAKKLGFCAVEVGHINISERDEEVPKGAKEEFISNHQLEYMIYNYTLKNYKK